MLEHWLFVVLQPRWQVFIDQLPVYGMSTVSLVLVNIQKGSLKLVFCQLLYVGLNIYHCPSFTSNQLAFYRTLFGGTVVVMFCCLCCLLGFSSFSDLALLVG